MKKFQDRVRSGQASSEAFEATRSTRRGYILRADVIGLPKRVGSDPILIFNPEVNEP